jgi:hypothetical protein
VTDEIGNNCGDINQAAVNWALNSASTAALNNYNKYGTKMVIGKDLGPYNAGPLWIWNPMKYRLNDDKTEVVIESVMMRTPLDYFLKAAAGYHYCKVLSPFKAIEWLYVDS